jgi:hypothetical protein
VTTQYEDIAGGGSFAKFDDIGDKVEGTVISATIDGATDFDGNPVPGIDIDTADGITTVTCSNASLKRKASTAISQGKLVRGCQILVELVGFYETNKGSKGKDFRLAVAPPALVDIADTTGF